MKKVLSFVLVLAMILGCCTVAFADYADGDKITNKEAVEVLSAVKVLAGDDKGNMNPTETLTRAEACTIVARLMLGVDEAQRLTAAGNPFVDVAADHWAAGFIAYCAAEGIVGGIGNGEFNPEGMLKVGEFGKMLLCVLGYNAATEGLIGPDWASNVTKLMVKAGLTVEQANTADCAREVAAQLALNALQANMVEYSTRGNSITVGDTTISMNGSKAEAVVAAGAAMNGKYNTMWKAAATTADPADGIVQLGEELFGGKLVLADAGSGDDFGRTAHTWTFKGVDIGTYTDDVAVKVYTVEKTATALDTELKGYVITAAAASVLENGTAATADVTSTALLAKLTGNGRIVELYATDSGKPKNIDKIVVIDEYLAQISKVDAANEELTYKPAGTYTGFSSAIKSEVGYGAYAKDDYVVVTVAGGEIQSVTSAEKVSGVITGNKTKKQTSGNNAVVEFKLDGATYKVAASSLDKTLISAGVSEAVCDAYLDSYGYVLKVNGRAGEGNYLLLTKYFADKDELNNPVDKAQVVFADGSVEVIKLATTAGLYQTAQTGCSYAVTPAGLYEYTSANGKYTLTQAVTTAACYGHFTNAAISTANNLGAHYFDTDVNFIAVENAGKTNIKVNSYTGKQKLGVASDLYYVTAKPVTNATGATITLVFALNGISTDTNDLVYVASGSAANGKITLSDGTTADTQEVYVSGVKDTVPVKAAAGGNAFYTMSIDDKGVYTLTVKGSDIVTDASLTFVYGDNVIIAGLNGGKSTEADEDIQVVDLRPVAAASKVSSVADLETLLGEAGDEGKTVKVAAAYNATSKTVTYIYVTYLQ